MNLWVILVSIVDYTVHLDCAWFEGRKKIDGVVRLAKIPYECKDGLDLPVDGVAIDNNVCILL